LKKQQKHKNKCRKNENAEKDEQVYKKIVRLWMNIREKVDVEPIKEKIIETCPRWYGHIRRVVEVSLEKLDHNIDALIKMGRSPKRVYKTPTKKNLLMVLLKNMVFYRSHFCWLVDSPI